MAETATVEAPVVETPVEVPATTLATEEASASSSEEQQATTEGTSEVKEPTLLEVASDPELLRKAIEAGVKPEEIHRAIREQETPDTGEEIRREAQRIREQEREAEDAVREREAWFAEREALGKAAVDWGRKQGEQFAALLQSDPEAAAELVTARHSKTGRLMSVHAIEDAEAGGVAATALHFARTVNKLLDSEHKAAIDALPDEKKAELKTARYEFATKGNAEPLLKIAFEAVATHKAAEAEAKGEVKGEKNAEATKASIDMMKKLRDAGVFGAPRVTGGAPRTTKTLGEFQKMNSEATIAFKRSNPDEYARLLRLSNGMTEE